MPSARRHDAHSRDPFPHEPRRATKLEELVKAAARPETNRLYRTVCRWWKEIEVLIITGATTGKVEANNTAIKNIKRTARGYRNPANYKSIILLRSAVRTAA
ncbi:transposase [Pseudarthrobacter oxydans]|uniref:transposase n=1 Tax=Pseudarthrobacter oxydans TaxID=1671 RepID=UPI002AA8154E|nr:transposase [Pseudarthrobacter oxydans]WPU08589.1 transposase [Pseudarthrobacter oxydans]